MYITRAGLTGNGSEMTFPSSGTASCLISASATSRKTIPNS